MKVRSFYKNQRELAIAFNEIIDAYWNETIDENKMVECIQKIYSNNNDKIIKETKYTKILQQQCGKKRLDLITKILNII